MLGLAGRNELVQEKLSGAVHIGCSVSLSAIPHIEYSSKKGLIRLCLALGQFAPGPDVISLQRTDLQLLFHTAYFSLALALKRVTISNYSILK